MKPNFFQQVVILAYILILAILCIFFVPFGTDEVEFDSIFSSMGHLVTFRFLTEILVFTIPTVILYKVSDNSKNPNYSLFELFTFKTKKSFWLYAILLFLSIPLFYFQYKNVMERGRIETLLKAKATKDSIAAANAANAAMEAANIRAVTDSAAKYHEEEEGNAKAKADMEAANQDFIRLQHNANRK